jgi:hypothetical protein
LKKLIALEAAKMVLDSREVKPAIGHHLGE